MLRLQKSGTPTEPVEMLILGGGILLDQDSEGRPVLTVDADFGGIGVAELDDLDDVVIASVGDGELLVFDVLQNAFVNATPAEAGLATVGHAHPWSDITGAPDFITTTKTVATSFAALSSSTATNLGANLLMYGNAHASTPNIGHLRIAGAQVLSWDGGGVTIAGNVDFTGSNFINRAGVNHIRFLLGSTYFYQPVTASAGILIGARVYMDAAASAATAAAQSRVAADAQYRYTRRANGDLEWGSGAAVADVRLQRAGANLLTIDNGAGGAGHLNLVGAGEFRVNSLKLISSRKTGWTIPTGTLSRAGYATGTATLTQVAQTLAALINDLHASGAASTHGLLGT